VRQRAARGDEERSGGGTQEGGHNPAVQQQVAGRDRVLELLRVQPLPAFDAQPAQQLDGRSSAWRTRSGAWRTGRPGRCHEPDDASIHFDGIGQGRALVADPAAQPLAGRSPPGNRLSRASRLPHRPRRTPPARTGPASAPGAKRHRWPTDVARTATMGHRCRFRQVHRHRGTGLEIPAGLEGTAGRQRETPEGDARATPRDSRVVISPLPGEGEPAAPGLGPEAEARTTGRSEDL
jgi:hypothetical protein